MSWDQIEGNWKLFKANVKRKWAELTAHEMDYKLNMLQNKKIHAAENIHGKYRTVKNKIKKKSE